MYYHASPTGGIKILEPRVSNHGIPLIYFSKKRENTLVYLSNAVEKYCRETGFPYQGSWTKWGSYGFTKEGILRLEEYYPNAVYDTYHGVSAYIYSTSLLADGREQSDIPDAVTSDHPVEVEACEFVADAYIAIMKAVEEGKMTLLKYEDIGDRMREWIRQSVLKEYRGANDHPEYRHFLSGKFPFLSEELGEGGMSDAGDGKSDLKYGTV